MPQARLDAILERAKANHFRRKTHVCEVGAYAEFIGQLSDERRAEVYAELLAEQLAINTEDRLIILESISIRQELLDLAIQRADAAIADARDFASSIRSTLESLDGLDNNAAALSVASVK